jgi:DNA helicase II / ATP-dependent DNA helicase PcrA
MTKTRYTTETVLNARDHIFNIVKPELKIWSDYQKEIFNNIATSSGDLIIEATPGSGKTTSSIESFKYIPKNKKAIALAFNKSIQEELKARSPSYVDALTFHSLGLRAIRQRFGPVQLEDNKVYTIVSAQFDRKTDHDLISNICDTVAYCKYSLQDIPEQIENIILEYGIDICNLEMDVFIRFVIKTLAMDKKDTDHIDFNDMCWFPFVYNLFLGSYDYVYIDEFQDLNKSQLIMAKKACALNGRIIATGDSNQSIYSWRASDTSVMDDIRKKQDTKTLTLPISYRCPKKIIELAKAWEPTITCPDTSIDGDIQEINMERMYKIASPGCFILSRTNAPLIKICMRFLREGVRANIRGRDVGKQLSSIVKRSKQKKVSALLNWLENWKDREIKKLKAKNLNTEPIADRYECLVNLCDDANSIQDVNDRISSLFNDNDESKIIIASTVHRVKGNERDNVFVLRNTFRTWFDTMDYNNKPDEEANIAYVAITRAKKNLYIVKK